MNCWWVHPAPTSGFHRPSGWSKPEDVVRVENFGMRLALILFLVAGLVGACAPVVAPSGLQHAPAAIEQDAFLTRDGLSLPLRHWDAPTPRAGIVARHG